jgi:hypothetical protein
MKRAIIISILISVFLYTATAYAQDRTNPIEYPFGTIGVIKPYFIWQDINNKRDGTGIQYRLTLTQAEGSEQNVKSYTFHPELLFDMFYFFKVPDALQTVKYNFTIDRLSEGTPLRKKYYYHLEYPVSGNFKIDPGEKNRIDTLSPEYLVRYIYLDNMNKLTNGYNIIFFSASGSITLALGIVIWEFVNIGIAGRIISIFFFTSSAIGYSAAAYYSVMYYRNTRKLHKIIELSRGVSLNGGIDGESIKAGFELKY